jgi:hypothetical protein
MCLVVAVEALKKKERQDETQFITKIGGKTSLGPSYFVVCKIFIPYYAKTGLFSPPNRLTFTHNLNVMVVFFYLKKIHNMCHFIFSLGKKSN